MRKLDRLPYTFGFLISRKCFLIDSQEKVREAKSLAVKKKNEGNNMRKQERENVSYHQQD